MYDPAIVAYDRIGLWITLIAVAAAISSVAGAIIARRKRFSELFWFIGCFVFPPLIVILILLPPSRGNRRGRRNMDSEGNGVDTFFRTPTSTRR